MIKLLADGSLPNLDGFFGAPFQITRYHSQQELHPLLFEHEILLCRSTLRVDAELLTHTRVRCVATASSGTDHIDGVYLKQHDIALLDAKGANARAVADYVITCVAQLQQQHKIPGMRAGVVGMGAVGTLVAARLRAVGFDVMCYDPLRAAEDASFQTCDFQALYHCNVISLHPNLHENAPYPSRHIIDADFLTHLQPHTVIMNASRGHVVDERALLTHGKHVVYCTDVYVGEPAIHPDVLAYATLCTPHIAGHSVEARHHALALLSQKIHLLYGLPGPELQKKSDHKIRSLDNVSGWQNAVLSLYDPEKDTQALKQAVDVSRQFLELRQSHHRHDFICYECQAIDNQLQCALGHLDE
ncbi:MAG: erythronate-4-phosphate dehydrogenase [Legionella sp.]|nr:MAG: erythronate-4-phosphate dehydrogenase [Legionella sp.]